MDITLDIRSEQNTCFCIMGVGIKQATDDNYNIPQSVQSQSAFKQSNKGITYLGIYTLPSSH